MFTVTKTYGHEQGLSATFRQHRAKSHCRFIHGYALSFRFQFAARERDENGWVKDFGSLRPLKEKLCNVFDHRLLIAQDDPAKEYLLSLGKLEDGLGADRDWQIRPQLAQTLVVPGVGCEAFAAMAWEWADELITKDERARGVHLQEVEVREHGANGASYTGNF